MEERVKENKVLELFVQRMAQMIEWCSTPFPFPSLLPLYRGDQCTDP